MPCLGCCRRGPVYSTQKSFTSSTILRTQKKNSLIYQIEQVGDADMDDSRQRNAQQVRMQLALTEELSSDTYGLEVVKKGKEAYEAQDFFAFKEILGSGATGVVFRAVFKPTGSTLAVKFIPNFKSVKTMVMRELKVLKLANECRFLIDFHSHFRVGSNLYFVMEICEGGSLEELIHPKYHMPAKLMKIYLKEISSALFYLHGLKLVHRDIAPPNLFIDGKGHLRLGDFGLCRMIDDPQGELLTDCGKPYTKAPEVYQDKHCTFAMDWWSVGILVYRFVTGYYPFRTEKLTQGYQSVTKHQEKYPEWIFVDSNVKALCQGLLNKKPRERLASENEEHAIKNHPYFHDIDWVAQEDVIRMAFQMLESGEDSSDATVLQRLLITLGFTPPCSQPTPLPPYPPVGPMNPPASVLDSLMKIQGGAALPGRASDTGRSSKKLSVNRHKGDGIHDHNSPKFRSKITSIPETTV